MTKKGKAQINFFQKIILWSRHLYHEVYQLLQNLTEGNTSQVSARFLRLHVVTPYNFETTTRACVWEAHWRQCRLRNSKNKVMRQSNQNFNIPPPPGKPRVFDYSLCPWSGEFNLCLGRVGKLEQELEGFKWFFLGAGVANSHKHVLGRDGRLRRKRYSGWVSDKGIFSHPHFIVKAVRFS